MQGSEVPRWVRLWNRPQTRGDVIAGALIAAVVTTIIFVARRRGASVVLAATAIVTAWWLVIGALRLRWRGRRG
jgi:hypothetical protein